jgi:arabinose-5-phosphate isomerase
VREVDRLGAASWQPEQCIVQDASALLIDQAVEGSDARARLRAQDMSKSAPQRDVKTSILNARHAALVGAVMAGRDGLDQLIHALTHDQLGENACAAVDLIHHCTGRIIVAGMGKSGHIARKLAATFSSTGTPAYYLHPAEASHGDLGMIEKQDIVLALSWSGETSEFAGILSYVKRFGVPLITITAGSESTLARHATIPLILPDVQEACPLGLAPTTSTVLQLALGDALAVALVEHKGFTAAEFGALHPGGRLGAQLKTVRDLMHEGERMPLVSEGTVMADAILEMSSKGFGIVGVFGRTRNLVGVVTDGDLRRHMTRDLMDRRVETVMSHKPVVVAADVLAGAALTLMQERKISAVFVIEGARPIGLLHMLDLVRSGVV